MDIFEGLSERQREAVETIDDDLEIIACAGAGKTGVVTRRIVNILKLNPGVLPENIVAFTFTKKAAEELKGRINAYGKSVLGHTKGFAHMYVGTIHGFCIRMLQDYIPEFQKFTVLDEIQTKLFVERYYEECGMQDLELKKYVETSLFISVMSVLNENWFEQDKWDEKTRIAFEKYRNKMYEEKKFDYSLILREMINQLETNCEFAEAIKNKVKYLTVDEYQDTNPIQEKLIEILKGFDANICVVGDDDQTIYQFRGSDPQNILTFKERYNIKKYIVLDKDYRSTETDKIWEQYSKVMCKWLSAATMVNMDKNNTISTNNLGREIGDFLSDEIFFPTTMLAQIIKVVELLADNKEGMTIQELKKSMKRSSLNGHLIDACFLGLVRPISRSEYEITQNGLEFLGKEPNEKRAYIREKLLGLEYVCQYLEQIKTTNKEPLEVFTNILDEMKVDKWNEVSIKWKHKLLRNWLIYSKLVVGKTHKKQVD